jgi:hypothetical protein
MVLEEGQLMRALELVLEIVAECNMFRLGCRSRGRCHCRICSLRGRFHLLLLVDVLPSREVIGKHPHPPNALCINIVACWEIPVCQPTLGYENDEDTAVNDVPLALTFVIELNVFNLQLLAGG